MLKTAVNYFALMLNNAKKCKQKCIMLREYFVCLDTNLKLDGDVNKISEFNKSRDLF